MESYEVISVKEYVRRNEVNLDPEYIYPTDMFWGKGDPEILRDNERVMRMITDAFDAVYSHQKTIADARADVQRVLFPTPNSDDSISVSSTGSRRGGVGVPLRRKHGVEEGNTVHKRSASRKKTS